MINSNTNTNLDIDKDKQNAIKNSKLQMSIKPFMIAREDLGKSKSVDKTRKGISRVKNGQLVYSNNKGGNHASSQNLHIGAVMGTDQARDGQALLPLSHKIHASQVYEGNREQVVNVDNFGNSVGNLNKIRVEQFSGSAATNPAITLNKHPAQSSSSSTLHYQSHYVSPPLLYNHPKPVPYSNPPPLPVPDHQQLYSEDQTKHMEVFDLHCKIELLEKQLTILEKENMEIRVENGIWRGKCVELEKERDMNNRSRDRGEAESSMIT